MNNPQQKIVVSRERRGEDKKIRETVRICVKKILNPKNIFIFFMSFMVKHRVSEQTNPISAEAKKT